MGENRPVWLPPAGRKQNPFALCAERRGGRKPRVASGASIRHSGHVSAAVPPLQPLPACGERSAAERSEAERWQTGEGALTTSQSLSGTRPSPDLLRFASAPLANPPLPACGERWVQAKPISHDLQVRRDCVDRALSSMKVEPLSRTARS
jgi:hypothetical protein